MSSRDNPRNQKAPTLAGRGIVAFVFLVALARVLPGTLENEELPAFWNAVPTMPAWQYVIEPWAGYLQVWARLAFLVAYPFGEWGPLVTRIESAAVVGLLAWFVLQAEAAIPDGRTRILAALALPLLPIGHPGPYDGPLNSQWWIAAIVLLVALSSARRWHYPAVFLAGLTGIAPCLVWPVFRDRRALPLIAASGFQLALMVTSERRGLYLHVPLELAIGMVALAVAMLLARLPTRTRTGFAYLGLAILVFGSLGTVPGDQALRYLAVPGIGVVLGLASAVRQDDDDAIAASPAALSAGLRTPTTTTATGPAARAASTRG